MGEVARDGRRAGGGPRRPEGAGTRRRPRPRTWRATSLARACGWGRSPADAFDGLRAAALARDPDELADFVELLREMFP